MSATLAVSVPADGVLAKHRKISQRVLRDTGAIHSDEFAHLNPLTHFIRLEIVTQMSINLEVTPKAPCRERHHPR